MVTKDDILQVAKLAKLYVADNELEYLTNKMQKMITFAERVNEATDDGEVFDNINNMTNVLRDDVITPSFDREDILKNASDRDDEYFIVKNRVI